MIAIHCYYVMSAWRKRHIALTADGRFLCGRLTPGCRFDIDSNRLHDLHDPSRYCERCLRELAKRECIRKWQAAHPERVREYVRKYRAAHREQLKEVT